MTSSIGHSNEAREAVEVVLPTKLKLVGFCHDVAFD